MHCKSCGSNLLEPICHYCQTDSGIKFVTKEQYDEMKRLKSFVFNNNHKEILGYFNGWEIVGDWL